MIVMIDQTYNIIAKNVYFNFSINSYTSLKATIDEH